MERKETKGNKRERNKEEQVLEVLIIVIDVGWARFDRMIDNWHDF
jgi:hypothetical protein